MTQAVSELPPAAAPDKVCTVVRPVTGFQIVDLPELWRYRELIWFFIHRDFKTRFTQTVLGFFWIIVPIILSAGLFTVILGYVVGMQTKGTSTMVFMLSGQLVWQFFNKSYGAITNTLFGNQALYTKVYFPRLIAPLSSSIGGVIDIAIGMLALIGISISVGQSFHWTAVFAPLYLLLAIVTAYSVGIWFAALSVKYRDIRMAGSYIPQFWMWCSGVVVISTKIYDSQDLPQWVKTLYQLNPMVVVVDGFRWSLFGVPYGAPTLLNLASVAIVLALLIPGLILFRRIESTFVDVV